MNWRVHDLASQDFFADLARRGPAPERCLVEMDANTRRRSDRPDLAGLAPRCRGDRLAGATITPISMIMHLRTR